MLKPYINSYFSKVSEIIKRLNRAEIERTIRYLLRLKKSKGRLFLLGVGGSGANCSHAVNDFRKICGIETYSPIDNVSEITARTNDDGWHTVFSEWLKDSKLTAKDAVMVFSVGGGNQEKNISPNIIEALKYARCVKSVILGIVGKDGGFTRKTADACIMIPLLEEKTATPLTESFQAVIWHLIVTHPVLRKKS